MYHQYFGFADAPFSIAPDPRYLYLSQRHQEALAHLLYGVNGDGGFVLLTGEIGAGKTTVCRCLLEQIPSDCDVAYIFNPKLTVDELLSTLCTEFGIAIPPGTSSVKVFVDCINAYLLDAHARQRHTVLIIDEAQNLSPVLLEQMRLLTNLETSQRKLLQIVLIGQPELATLLERPELRQVSQRIVARYHLGPLSKTEVAAYVRHRLEVAGAKPGLIPARLTGRLYRLSAGIPRVINVLCDRALLGAYVEGKDHVDGATLKQAAREALHRPARSGMHRLFALSAALLVVVAAALVAALYRYEPEKSPAAALLPAQAGSPQPVQSVALSVGAAQADALPAQAVPAATLSPNLAWPASEPLAESLPLAYATLLRLWGQDYRAGADACQQAGAFGLRCYSTRGGLDELRRLNRPAVLRMRGTRGEEFHATLTALDENSASFAIGAERTRIALSALAAQWSGHYLVLWRPPAQVAGELIRAGERGPAAQWLAAELALANGRRASPNDKAVFDDALAREVKAFQLAQGLVPDGAVGRQTLMRLASLDDHAAPTLKPRQTNK